MTRARILRSVWLASLLVGCGARTEPTPPPIECTDPAPTCIVDGAFCDPATLVDAQCDATTHRFRCPPTARLYERAPDTGASCLPFERAPGLSTLGNWGLSSLARVPTDDGRCLWIADSAKLSDGLTARNVAFEADRRAPFGTCPTTSMIPPTRVVTMEGGDDPSLLVQIDHGYRLGGRTHVLYRLFRYDASAAFGVTEIGSGLARWDAATQRIVVPSPKKPFPWGLDLDLGDAVLLDDSGHAFVWGCTLEGVFLRSSCRLARLDADDSVELYRASGAFIRSTRAKDASIAFTSASWSSSVVAVPGGFRHLFVGAFGRELLQQTASSPLGPWSAESFVAPCEVPKDQEKAMCAGPIAHMEIADPTRPNEVPIVYAVGTTGTPSDRREDYWTRLVWLP